MRNPLWKMGLFLRKRINSPKKDLLAVQLFVFHMDGVTQTGFCWSVINEWGESSKWHPVTSFTILGYRLLMAVKLYVCWDAVYSGE